MQKLRSIGVFRMLAPRSHGGLELDLPAAVEILTALARIDGSVGWCATITSGASIVAALLPPQTYEQIYRNGPDVILAGSATTPGGTAEAAPGRPPSSSPLGPSPSFRQTAAARSQHNCSRRSHPGTIATSWTTPVRGELGVSREQGVRDHERQWLAFSGARAATQPNELCPLHRG